MPDCNVVYFKVVPNIVALPWRSVYPKLYQVFLAWPRDLSEARSERPLAGGCNASHLACGTKYSYG